MSWMPSIPTDATEWLRYVQLCYIWYSDGDCGQCGIGEGRELVLTPTSGQHTTEMIQIIGAEAVRWYGSYV